MTDPSELQATLATLQALAGQCLQVQAGLRSSAGQAQAEDVRALLRRRAEEYRRQAEELQAHVHRLAGAAGPMPASGPEALWAVAHAVQASHRDQALLAACEAAEDAALERYTEALSEALEPATREVIATQRLEMQRQHVLLRAMRDRLRGLDA